MERSWFLNLPYTLPSSGCILFPSLLFEEILNQTPSTLMISLFHMGMDSIFCQSPAQMLHVLDTNKSTKNILWNTSLLSIEMATARRMIREWDLETMVYLKIHFPLHCTELVPSDPLYYCSSHLEYTECISPIFKCIKSSSVPGWHPINNIWVLKIF